MISESNNIYLIGPLATGKSTIAARLSELTGLANYPIDKLKWFYRFKNGYDLKVSSNILKTQGFRGLLKYSGGFFGPKELRIIEKEFQGIIDLGASDTHANNLDKQVEILNVFENVPNIFLILPSPSEKECIKILDQRLLERYKNDRLKLPVIESYIEMNKVFIRSVVNREIAKHTVYTNGRTVEEVSIEIIKKVQYKQNERSHIKRQRFS